MKRSRRVQRGGIFGISIPNPFDGGINKLDEQGFTQLYRSVRDNRTGAVKELLEKSADVNKQSPGNPREQSLGTPLHVAAFKGYTEIMQRLLGAGANVNVLNGERLTPLSIAIESHIATPDNILHNVNILIYHGANVNVEGESISPLYFACKNRKREIVETLLNEGANVNAATSRFHDTPLHIAIIRYNPDIVTQLLAAGANVNARNLSGQTPLHLAKDVNAVTQLLAAGANINERDGSQQTLLHIASLSGNLNIVRFLLESGADVTLRDNDNRTALDLVRYRRGLEEIDNLLRAAQPVVPVAPEPVVLAAPAAPAAPRGVAFEIHDAFYKINKGKLFEFMERQIPNLRVQFNAAPKNPEFGEYVIQSLRNLYEELPGNIQANRNRKQQALTHLESFSERLKSVNYNDETRKIIFYALEFTKQQPAEFKNEYIKNFSYDCALAYGARENPISCTKGIMERILTTLTPSSKLYAGSPVYDELVSIINPPTVDVIVREVGGECARIADVTEEQYRACVHEKVRERYETLELPYSVEEVDAELNRMIPILGIFGGARKTKKTKRSKRSKRRGNASRRR